MCTSCKGADVLTPVMYCAPCWAPDVHLKPGTTNNTPNSDLCVGSTVHNEYCKYGTACLVPAQVLDLLNATWKDALRLPNVGPVPSPDPPTPVTDPPATTDVSLPTDDPTIRTDSPTTDRTDYPTDIIDLTPSSQSPLYPSTHLLSVLVTLVAALLLR